MGLNNASTLSTTPPTGPGWDSWDLEKIIEPTKQELIEKLSFDPKEYFVQKMGSYLHEEWRKTRLKEDWTYEPRMKKSKD